LEEPQIEAIVQKIISGEKEPAYPVQVAPVTLGPKQVNPSFKGSPRSPRSLVRFGETEQDVEANTRARIEEVDAVKRAALNITGNVVPPPTSNLGLIEKKASEGLADISTAQVLQKKIGEDLQNSGQLLKSQSEFFEEPVPTALSPEIEARQKRLAEITERLLEEQRNVPDVSESLHSSELPGTSGLEVEGTGAVPQVQGPVKWEFGKVYKVLLGDGIQEIIFLTCKSRKMGLLGYLTYNDKKIRGFFVTNDDGFNYLQRESRNKTPTLISVIDVKTDEDLFGCTFNESEEYFIDCFESYNRARKLTYLPEAEKYMTEWKEKPRDFFVNVTVDSETQTKHSIQIKERDGFSYKVDLTNTFFFALKQCILGENGYEVETLETPFYIGNFFCINTALKLLGFTSQLRNDGDEKFSTRATPENTTFIKYVLRNDPDLLDENNQSFDLLTALRTAKAIRQKAFIYTKDYNFYNFVDAFSHGYEVQNKIEQVYKDALHIIYMNTSTYNTKEMYRLLDRYNVAELINFKDGVLHAKSYTSKPTRGGKRTLFKKIAPLACTSRPGGNGCLSAFFSRRARRPHPHLSAARFQTRRSTPPSAALSRRGRTRAPSASNR